MHPTLGAIACFNGQLAFINQGTSNYTILPLQNVYMFRTNGSPLLCISLKVPPSSAFTEMEYSKIKSRLSGEESRVFDRVLIKNGNQEISINSPTESRPTLGHALSGSGSALAIFFIILSILSTLYFLFKFYKMIVFLRVILKIENNFRTLRVPAEYPISFENLAIVLEINPNQLEKIKFIRHFPQDPMFPKQKISPHPTETLLRRELHSLIELNLWFFVKRDKTPHPK